MKTNSLQYFSSTSNNNNNNGRSTSSSRRVSVYGCGGCCSHKMITISVLTIVLICYTTYTHQSFQKLRNESNGMISPLNDKTFRWSPATTKRHLWLEYEEQEQRNHSQLHGITTTTTTSEQKQKTTPKSIIEKPTYMILLTNYGWNQKNWFRNKLVPRCIRTSELIQGVIDHPNFHPTAYE